MLEWPQTITLPDGKLEFIKADIGQVMHRAETILTMQPYRDYVVLPIYTRTEIQFLYVARDFSLIKVSKVLELFIFHDEAELDLKSIGDGFRLLVHFMNHPDLMGYKKCPIVLYEIDGYNYENNAIAVCGRSIGKAIFLYCDVILKVFQETGIAECEFEILKRLQGIHGIPTLLTNTAVGCIVSDRQQQESENTSRWIAIPMKPYCTVLTASIATPQHFAGFATILAEAAAAGFNNNDISFDNLMICTDPASTCSTYIVDWGLATPIHSYLSSDTGKQIFIPLSCIDKEEGTPLPRFSSLLHDLESLYLVAVCCSCGDVPWADSSKLFRYHDCAKVSGIGLAYEFYEGGKQQLNKKWKYLTPIANELSKRNGDVDVKLILKTFQTGWMN